MTLFRFQSSWVESALPWSENETSNLFMYTVLSSTQTNIFGSKMDIDRALSTINCTASVCHSIIIQLHAGLVLHCLSYRIIILAYSYRKFTDITIGHIPQYFQLNGPPLQVS